MMLGVGHVAAQCTGDFDVSFGGVQAAGIEVTGSSLSTPGLDLSGIHSNLLGMTAFVPQGPFPLSGGETVTVRCCTSECEVVVGAYTCFPCSAGKNGMIPSVLRNLGFDGAACGARFGPDSLNMGTFRSLLDTANPEVTFTLDGTTQGMAVFLRAVGVPSTLNLPATATSEFVHAMAVLGGHDVEITSSQASLTYTAAGNVHDGIQAWNDRVYTLENVDPELQAATYYRPSKVKSIASGTTISVTGKGPMTVYMIVETRHIGGSNDRHGNFFNTLPLNGWTRVLASNEPIWLLQSINRRSPMAVFKMQMEGEPAQYSPTAQWCPRPQGPFPSCVCPGLP